MFKLLYWKMSEMKEGLLMLLVVNDFNFGCLMDLYFCFWRVFFILSMCFIYYVFVCVLVGVLCCFLLSFGIIILWMGLLLINVLLWWICINC